MKQPRLYIVLGIAVLLCPAFTQPAIARVQGGHLVLIFDASGSMWGQVDCKAKIQIAKEVLDSKVKSSAKACYALGRRQNIKQTQAFQRDV